MLACRVGAHWLVTALCLRYVVCREKTAKRAAISGAGLRGATAELEGTWNHCHRGNESRRGAKMAVHPCTAGENRIFQGGLDAIEGDRGGAKREVGGGELAWQCLSWQTTRRDEAGTIAGNVARLLNAAGRIEQPAAADVRGISRGYCPRPRTSP